MPPVFPLSVAFVFVALLFFFLFLRNAFLIIRKAVINHEKSEYLFSIFHIYIYRITKLLSSFFIFVEWSNNRLLFEFCYFCILFFTTAVSKFWIGNALNICIFFILFPLVPLYLTRLCILILTWGKSIRRKEYDFHFYVCRFITWRTFMHAFLSWWIQLDLDIKHTLEQN